MEKELKINTTRCCRSDDGDDEPVSPMGQYLNSSVLSLSILVVMESQIPIDDCPAMDLLRDVFLPINPRFSSVMVVNSNGVKQWKKVDVQLHDHINIPTFPPNLPPKSYDKYFDDYLTKTSMEPLSPTRPLWDIHIIKYPTTNAPGHLIFKLHHSLGDGYTLMGVLLSCLQRADKLSRPLTFPTFLKKKKEEEEGGGGGGEKGRGFYVRKLIAGFPRALSVGYNTVCDFGWSMLKSSLVEDDVTPIRASASESVEWERISIMTVTVPLERMKRIKHVLQVTINDVVSGVICYATRLYMQGSREESSRSHSTALILLRTRNIDGYRSVAEMLKSNKDQSWGNKFAFLHTSMPKLDGQSDPLKFIFEIKKILEKKKNSLAAYFTGQTLDIIRRCAGPEAAAKMIHSTLRNSSLGITNIIGPIEQVSLANHPVKGLYFMVLGSPQALTMTVLSYAGAIRISVGAQKDLVDNNKFIRCIEETFESVYISCCCKEPR